jgi:hypothetical protein
MYLNTTAPEMQKKLGFAFVGQVKIFNESRFFQFLKRHRIYLRATLYIFVVENRVWWCGEEAGGGGAGVLVPMLWDAAATLLIYYEGASPSPSPPFYLSAFEGPGPLPANYLLYIQALKVSYLQFRTV